MQNTFFSTLTLSSRSFPLSSPNSEVAVSIANVQDPLSLCSHALWFSSCFVETKQLFFGPNMELSSFWTGLSMVPDVQGENDDVSAIAG